MSIERIDWVNKLRESAGCKTWKDYCDKLGVNYHVFMVRIDKGKITETMADVMGKFHGMDLHFLVNDDTHNICTTSTNTSGTTSKKSNTTSRR